MARPVLPESKRKVEIVRFRVTEGELKTLELMAGQQRGTVSDVLRELVTEGAKLRGVLPTDEERRREGVILA